MYSGMTWSPAEESHVSTCDTAEQAAQNFIKGEGTRLDRGDALTHALDDTTTFMAEDDGEDALRVLAAQGVSVGVAHARRQDLDAHLTRLRGRHLDLLDRCVRLFD